MLQSDIALRSVATAKERANAELRSSNRYLIAKSAIGHERSVETAVYIGLKRQPTELP